MRKKTFGWIIVGFGILIFAAGLYLLPVGTDIFLWFFVEVVAHGNWLLGDIYANAVAICMIALGYGIMRMEGVKPGLKKAKKSRGRGR